MPEFTILCPGAFDYILNKNLTNEEEDIVKNEINLVQRHYS